MLKVKMGLKFLSLQRCLRNQTVLSRFWILVIRLRKKYMDLSIKKKTKKLSMNNRKSSLRNVMKQRKSLKTGLKFTLEILQ